MLGIVLQRVVVKSTIIEMIQGEVKAMTSSTETTLGTKVSVCSWICVTAWNKLIKKPTSRPTPTAGMEIRIVILIAWNKTCTTKI